VNRLKAPWLILASLFAVTVAIADTVSWSSWLTISRSLEVRPEAAARQLSSSPWLAIPSFTARTRRLPVRELQGASVQSILDSLTRIGLLERRWLPADAVGFVNRSRELFLRGDPRASVHALASALLRDPTSAYLRRLHALFLFSIGDRRSALHELAEAEAIAPGLRAPQVELTPEDARRVHLEGLRRRMEYYPRRVAESAVVLARELRVDGHEVEARELLSELRGRPDAEIEIARWAIDEGAFEDALDVLLPIATRHANPRPLRARAWSMAAVARDLDGDRDGAMSAAREALDLDPDSPAPYITLAGLAQGRGDLNAALEHLRRAWGMNPTDTRLLTRIAAVAEQSGKPEDALLALERAVEIEPGSAVLASRLVELQLRTGHYAEAAITLSQALDRHPTDAGLLRLAERLQREIISP
jgi:tetratricopeptide (TPR) repeat protein